MNETISSVSNSNYTVVKYSGNVSFISVLVVVSLLCPYIMTQCQKMCRGLTPITTTPRVVGNCSHYTGALSTRCVVHRLSNRTFSFRQVDDPFTSFVVQGTDETGVLVSLPDILWDDPRRMNVSQRHEV